jgi:hypothetical protein
MDMSSFQKMGTRRSSARRPDFESLRAAIVARQALQPTALAMAMVRNSAPVPGDSAATVLSVFQSGTHGFEALARAAGSFHAAVAARLLTREQ